MRSYFKAFDYRDLLSQHPIGDSFESFAKSVSRDELHARQDGLFRRCLIRAWVTGFYQSLWGKEGIEPGDIRGLEDISRLPVFDKSDLMQSMSEHPPWGDFAGFALDDSARAPVVLHTTSGTTGAPQVLLFGAKSGEVQNLLLGRVYRMQGVRSDDVVHSVYGHGLINGGHYIREAFLHWTNALFLSAGTGVENRSVRQVELMRDFKVTVLVGFADYLKRLAEVAVEQGLAGDIHVRLISGQLGREDRDLVSKLWGGAECYDWYGEGDTGVIAAEGADHQGLYVMEDAHYLQLLDMDTARPVAEGSEGDMVCTCLFKDDVYPIIRFNTHDVSSEFGGQSNLGFSLRRISGFLGRSDNMVKVKGINLFPQALGPLLDEVPKFLGEYVCRLTEAGQFILLIEVTQQSAELTARIGSLLKAKLGISIDLAFAGRGETAELTEVDRRQKPIRLIDERNK